MSADVTGAVNRTLRRGFNSVRNESCGTAIASGRINSIAATDSVTDFKFLTSKSDYLKSCTVTCSVSTDAIPASVFSMNASVGSITENSFENNNLWCVFRFRALLRIDQIEDAKMLDETNRLLRENRDQFFRQYGDSYISEIGYGREIVLWAEIQLTKEERKKMRKANLQIGALSASAVKASIQSVVNRRFEDIHCKFYLEQGGANIVQPKATTCDGIFDYISKLPKELQNLIDHSTDPMKPLWGVKTNYDSVRNVYYPGASEIREVTQYALSKLALIESVRQSYLRSEEFMKNNWDGQKNKELEMSVAYRQKLNQMADRLKEARLSQMVREIIATKKSDRSSDETLQGMIDALEKIRTTRAMYQTESIIAKRFPERTHDQAERKFEVEAALLEGVVKLVFLLYNDKLTPGFKFTNAFTKTFYPLGGKALGKDYKPPVETKEKAENNQTPKVVQRHEVVNIQKHKQDKTFCCTSTASHDNPKEPMLSLCLFIPDDVEDVKLSDSPMEGRAAKLLEQADALKAREEKEKLEKERLVKEKLEKERLEKEKLEKEKLEKERLEKERAIREKIRAEEENKALDQMKRIWGENLTKTRQIKPDYVKRLTWLGLGRVQHLLKTKGKRKRGKQFEFLQALVENLKGFGNDSRGLLERCCIILGALAQLRQILIQERGNENLSTAAFTVTDQLLEFVKTELRVSRAFKAVEEVEKLQPGSILRFSSEKYQHYVNEHQADFEKFKTTVLPEFIAPTVVPSMKQS